MEIKSNPVPLPELYFDSFSYPVASIVFCDMAIVSLFLLLFFLANPKSSLERYRLTRNKKRNTQIWKRVLYGGRKINHKSQMIDQRKQPSNQVNGNKERGAYCYYVIKSQHKLKDK